ncbi:MAG: Lrp/AsnC family transcriptional regulator [Candidatus Thermoplasmatota archaeon]|nr:Lrp/AsnC family transcriptional regulator [Candidatus Thermoplasmatota archaeon]
MKEAYEQTMENVDLKDRRILYELDQNSRESFTQIGKRVGLHKNVVNYRIKRLQDKGIIKDFYTVIDTFKLGYNSLRFYLVYQNTTPSIRDEIIAHFVENKFTWWVGSFEGEYDLAVVVWIKDLQEFYSFWETTLRKYHRYFKKQMFSLYEQLRQFRHSFLMIDEYDKEDREKFEITGGGKKIKTDETDFEILSLLAKNARIPTVRIAEELDMTVDTILNRIQNLESLDIIQAYRVNIDYGKLNYHLFKVNLTLNNYSKRGKIINYIKYNPHLIMIDKAIGFYDLELDFHLKNLDHLRSVMDDLSEKFPEDINCYNFVHDPIKHKMVYIPKQ